MKKALLLILEIITLFFLFKFLFWPKPVIDSGQYPKPMAIPVPTPARHGRI